jgi:diacylglycerol kinase family enzyme
VRIVLIVNSAASSVDARTRVLVEAALSERHDVRVALTLRRGHATELARWAAADGADVVVVLGGDGTLNEAANGLLGSECALAVLPGGSTNVFARTIGMPNNAADGIPVLLAALERALIESIGVGTANGRAFLFHAGLGYDAAVVAEVERHPGLKRRTGQGLFVFAAFDTWFRHYDRANPHFAVHLPDGTVIEDGYLTIVLNTDPYTYLGRRAFRVSPDARLDKPLSSITLRSLAFFPLARVAVASLLGRGNVRSFPTVEAHDDLDHLDVVGFRPFPYQLDGDHIGVVDRVEIRHLPAALRLVMP